MTAFRALRRSLALAAISVSARGAGAETYDVDAVHSTVMFRAKRMGVVYVYGRFNEFAGTVDMTGEDVATGKLALEVKTSERRHRQSTARRPPAQPGLPQRGAASGDEVRDHRRARRGGGAFEVTGNLTLHGVTKPVTATVEKVGSGKDPRAGKTLVGFEAKFTLKRSDFDIKYMVGPVSDEIDVHIALQAVAR